MNHKNVTLGTVKDKLGISKNDNENYYNSIVAKVEAISSDNYYWM